MKVYILLALFFAAVLGEQKVNLEDIERDNLRAEAKTKEEYSGSAESAPSTVNYKYQYQYQPQQQGQELSNQPQDIKYTVQQEAYNQNQGYSGNEVSYQQQHQNSIVSGPAGNQQQVEYQTAYQQVDVAQSEPQQHQHSSVSSASGNPQQVQYQTTYQQVDVAQSEPQHQQHNSAISASAGNAQQVEYQTAYQQVEVPQGNPHQQQYVYQPEVNVGNQIQSIQQKIAADKYVQDVSKDSVNVNVAENQLLSYYPNAANGAAAKQQVQPLLHKLASQAAQKFPVPVYTSALAENQLNQVQQQYQVSYAPQYVQAAKPVYDTKGAQNLAYTLPASVHPMQQSYVVPFYTQGASFYPQQDKFVYPQAYQSQLQTQYVQDQAYNQGNSLYANIFAHNPVNFQDHAAAYAQGNQYFAPPQQFNVPNVFAEQLTKHILEQQSSQSISQNYAKIPGAPRANFVHQQLPVQKFNNDVTRLVPVHNQYQTSGHTSLLDSYVPSRVIAAQNVDQYRERPLQLEGGFLPSKGAFEYSHKKRKAE